MFSDVPIYFSLVDNWKIYVINIHSLTEILLSFDFKKKLLLEDLWSDESETYYYVIYLFARKKIYQNGNC